MTLWFENVGLPLWTLLISENDMMEGEGQEIFLGLIGHLERQIFNHNNLHGRWSLQHVYVNTTWDPAGTKSRFVWLVDSANHCTDANQFVQFVGREWNSIAFSW